MTRYYPEGQLLETPENKRLLSSITTLSEAQQTGRICEAWATVCDSTHNLWVNLGSMRGQIPRAEGAIGMEDGSAKDIAVISRVGKPVCFVVTGFSTTASGETIAMLSRREAQEKCRREYLQQLKPGDILPARVTHLDQFGCFADIGCGVCSLLPIDAISVSRISHPRDRFRLGESIYVILKGVDEFGRLCLSHKELLGSWDENASTFSAGETVAGVVRSVESYGVFIELRPNLAGLAEPFENVEVGQQASVYIKSLIPEKMKIKLIIIDVFDHKPPYERPQYFFSGNHMDRWRYSPENCPKLIETVFTAL